MPVSGRKPKPEGHAVNRGAKAYEWTDVVDAPYMGERPALPLKRTIFVKDGLVEVPISAATKGWWAAVCEMPHCVLWTSADWQFAVMTAGIADAAFQGSISAAAELRMREKIMGTTLDARRDLRIRYVEAVEHVLEDDGPPAEDMARWAERRRRLTGAS